ncbi:MAG: 2-oxoacid:acceptor oxidoreductase family protein [Desulfobacterales bacterium]|nr:2-oxoacid:acceptor oxidoreductase family protein [Desulfobacterales bacterium]MDJ0988361.1 2-oxoacid:acceptor oxidoreductase family protein [Desulfobacterales bacterium]
MSTDVQQQIVISGVGGQGVLFVTRLIAEAAITRGLSVLTSETHGMAQRGGSVVSHLKIGDFASPLIRSGCADGLLGLKAESRDLHGHFIRADGWQVVNATAAAAGVAHVDADAVAARIENPRAVNLVVLGFALARLGSGNAAAGELFCKRDDIVRVLETRLAERPELLAASRRALDAGCAAGSG